MGNVTNLRTARKQKAREEKRANASAKATLHGESKAERLLRTTRSEAEKRHLDQHYTEDD